MLKALSSLRLNKRNGPFGRVMENVLNANQCLIANARNKQKLYKNFKVRRLFFNVA